MIGASPHERNLPGTFFRPSFRDAFQSVSVIVRYCRRCRPVWSCPTGSARRRGPRLCWRRPGLGEGLWWRASTRAPSVLVSTRRPVAESSAGRPRWTWRAGELLEAGCRRVAPRPAPPGGAPHGIRSAGFSCRLVAAWSPPSAVPRTGTPRRRPSEGGELRRMVLSSGQTAKCPLFRGLRWASPAARR